MTTVARWMLIGMALAVLYSLIAEARADYMLMLVHDDGVVVAVARYEEETPCWMDYRAYERGDRLHPDVVNAYAGGCVPCDEFPAQCVEGI